jgi:hypothetical protein
MSDLAESVVEGAPIAGRAVLRYVVSCGPAIWASEPGAGRCNKTCRNVMLPKLIASD